MNQNNRENSGGAERTPSDEGWLVAYENHVVQGGPTPGDFPEDLSDVDKRELADARRAIDELHGVFTKGRVAAEPANAEQPPKHLGDFRILHEIGRGGMGVVYEAEQISLPRRVALKILPFAAVLDPRQLERFKNEARAAATLHRHSRKWAVPFNLCVKFIIRVISCHNAKKVVRVFVKQLFTFLS
jgi:serine/threonine protein kinase